MLLLMSSLVKPRCNPISHCGIFLRSSLMLADGSSGILALRSYSAVLGDGGPGGGDICWPGLGSKESIPGRRTVCCCCCGPLLFSAGKGSWGALICEDVMTWLKRLPGLVKLLLSGCQVLLRHASSALLVTDSRRDHPLAVDVVGDAR